ncbi:hypothetical protein E2C01_047173 [Portunus trituberculatus]|uniref:Uncharacterized protein n=1 Tax=Portunus trituberculatus TaxID=210409 RepID=A0A5B7G9R3_PORTR|nr:hypothetical protein [Portunus trituberculatus]
MVVPMMLSVIVYIAQMTPNITMPHPRRIKILITKSVKRRKVTIGSTPETSPCSCLLTVWFEPVFQSRAQHHMEQLRDTVRYADASGSVPIDGLPRQPVIPDLQQLLPTGEHAAPAPSLSLTATPA